jgi:hypothetical protein
MNGWISCTNALPWRHHDVQEPYLIRLETVGEFYWVSAITTGIYGFAKTDTLTLGSDNQLSDDQAQRGMALYGLSSVAFLFWI